MIIKATMTHPVTMFFIMAATPRIGLAHYVAGDCAAKDDEHHGRGRQCSARPRRPEKAGVDGQTAPLQDGDRSPARQKSGAEDPPAASPAGEHINKIAQLGWTSYRSFAPAAELTVGPMTWSLCLVCEGLFAPPPENDWIYFYDTSKHLRDRC
jgi:hypothetical protein